MRIVSIRSTSYVAVMALAAIEFVPQASAFVGHQTSPVADSRLRQPTAKIASATSTSLNLARKNAPDQIIGSELFPAAGTSYVPFGLSPEEYAKIKRDEQAKTKSKDFASFGPRFAKTEKPSGDWMISPSLWTGGFNSNKSAGKTVASPAGATPASNNGNSMNPKIGNVPAYALTLLLIETLATSAFISNKKISSSLFAVALLQAKRSATVVQLSTAILAKVTLGKMVLAAALLKPMKMVIEKCNQKFLWSPRRIMASSSVASTGTLAVTGIIATKVLKLL
jgi:hypothetical protein